MYRDPDTAFRRKMSEFGLDPGPIIWDRRVHHFPGEDKAEKNPRYKSAWYVGFSDRSGGMFGDFSQALEQVTWQMKRDRPPTRAEIEEWARLDRENAKRQAEARARATNEVQAAWDAAEPANRVHLHPYLESKRIISGIADLRVLRKDTPGLKIMGNKFNAFEDMLLIPMRKNHDQLVNVQIVLESGSKRYWPGAVVVGAACAVEHDDLTSDMIYLCEDWVTAWSISRCAAAFCIATFTPGGLLAEAQWLRSKYGNELNYIIAADNDRWTDLNDGTPNPGVHFASLAAEALGAGLAIPDFEDLALRSTNFNDLHRIEGEKAVKKWLSPTNSKHALTVPEVMEPDREAGPDQEWYQSAPFGFLGMDGDHSCRLSHLDGRIVRLKARGHPNDMELARLAKDDWWAEKFPSSSQDSGVDWKKAAKAILHRNQEVGDFDPARIRGRGFWRDGVRVVGHFGDRLLPPGSTTTFLRPERYQGHDRMIYPRRRNIGWVHPKRALAASEIQVLVDMFTSLAWDDEASGHLLAGWVALAPFSGLLDWRPHVWLTGPSGCGKTTVIRRMVLPLLGGMGLDLSDVKTKACIRRELEADALPVVHDGVESGACLKAYLSLARRSSSRSMVLLSSCSAMLRAEADRSRFSILSLADPSQLDAAERRKAWIDSLPELAKHCTRKRGRRLIRRTLHAWVRRRKFRLLHDTVTSAAHTVLMDARAADQLGTLATGTWSMLAETVPAEAEVVDWFHSLGIDTRAARNEPEGYKVLATILQHSERARTSAGQHRLTNVGELVDVVAAGPAASTTMVPYLEAVEALKRSGLLVVDGLPGEEQFLAVGSQGPLGRKKLLSTHGTAWVQTLRTIPGTRADKARRFGAGIRSRTTLVPISYVLAKTSAADSREQDAA